VQSLIQTAGAAQSPGRVVPVLYGGRRMDFKPEDLLLRQDKAHDAGEGPPEAAAAPTPVQPAPQAALQPGQAPFFPASFPIQPSALPR